MANSVDPDQTALSGAVWSGFTLFAYTILSETLVYKISDIYYIDVLLKNFLFFDFLQVLMV